MARYVSLVVALWLAIAMTGQSPAHVAQPKSASVPVSSAQALVANLLVADSVSDDTKPPPPEQDLTEPDPSQPTDNETPPADEVSIGEIPVVEMVDLTTDMAQRAIDAYVLLKEKYKDAQLENFDSLQDFVDNDPQGKTFEADVKAAGFANVTIWNQTITTVSSAYSNIVDDQTTDIKSQIEDVQKDSELAQDMKDRIIASLNALIPSENNRKVVQELMDNPVYVEKLKLLETEEE